jgi:Na+-translocating ferredoxin:NAD+ oxidoreductase subunit G
MAGHETKNFSMFAIVSNLAMACIVSGLIIALTYYFTAPVAAQKSELLKTQSMQALVADADKFEAVKDKAEWFAAEKGGKTVAYVVPAETKGFGGVMKLIVAVTPDGKVVRYDILSHNETPGLGDNALKPAFKNQFTDKTSKDLVVVKDPSLKDNIQAMTGATITSRAVVKAVKEAVDEVTAYTGGK